MRIRTLIGLPLLYLAAGCSALFSTGSDTEPGTQPCSVLRDAQRFREGPGEWTTFGGQTRTDPTQGLIITRGGEATSAPADLTVSAVTVEIASFPSVDNSELRLSLLDSSGEAVVSLGRLQDAGATSLGLRIGDGLAENTTCGIDEPVWRFRVWGGELIAEAGANRGALTTCAVTPVSSDLSAGQIALRTLGGITATAQAVITSANITRPNSDTWCPAADLADSFDDGMVAPKWDVHEDGVVLEEGSDGLAINFVSGEMEFRYRSAEPHNLQGSGVLVALGPLPESTDCRLGVVERDRDGRQLAIRAIRPIGQTPRIELCDAPVDGACTPLSPPFMFETDDPSYLAMAGTADGNLVLAAALEPQGPWNRQIYQPAPLNIAAAHVLLTATRISAGQIFTITEVAALTPGQLTQLLPPPDGASNFTR